MDRVSNHMFCCSRSNNCANVCLFCTRVNVSHCAISGYIHKKLFVSTLPHPLEKVFFQWKKFIFLFISTVPQTVRKIVRNIQIILLFITLNTSALHFCSTRCIWNLCVGLPIISLTKKFCLTAIQISVRKTTFYDKSSFF